LANLKKYFVNFEPNQERVVDYIDVNVSQSKEVLAEPKYQLDLSLELKKTIEIIESDHGQTKIGTSQNLALINVSCDLTFELQNSGEQKRIEMKPTGNSRLYVGGNSIFSAPIDAKDVEYLNSWRKGDTLLIKWKLSGHAAVIDSDRIFPVLWIDVSNIKDNRNILPSLNSDRFFSKIMKPVKLSHTFLVQFPLEVSNIIKTAADLPAGISGLKNYLYSLVDHLNTAVHVLRNAKSDSDYRQVMDQVKSSLDAIRKYSNKKDLGKELLIQTRIIDNIDSSAGDIAAEEVMNDFFEILEKVYHIASKPAHTKGKGKSGGSFAMNPHKAEAVYVLTMGLAASKFLLERIETYIMTIV
jgi:hypothetical protein